MRSYIKLDMWLRSEMSLELNMKLRLDMFFGLRSDVLFKFYMMLRSDVSLGLNMRLSSEIFLDPLPLFAQNSIKCIKDAAKVLKPKRNLTPLANLKLK